MFCFTAFSPPLLRVTACLNAPLPRGRYPVFRPLPLTPHATGLARLRTLPVRYGSCITKRLRAALLARRDALRRFPCTALPRGYFCGRLPRRCRFVQVRVHWRAAYVCVRTDVPAQRCFAHSLWFGLPGLVRFSFICITVTACRCYLRTVSLRGGYGSRLPGGLICTFNAASWRAVPGMGSSPDDACR